MEKKEKFNPDFNKDIAKSDWFWNYMEDYWHNNREFPESVENHLNRKADLIDGKVPSSQLPSYVDDVLEFNAFENLPNSGEKGKIYLVTNNNTQFRWSGSEYIQINSDENLMTLNTVQDITGHKQFNAGLSLGLNQKMHIKSANDVAHYVANFADDLDGFAVSKGFAIKPFNDTASNWFLVNGKGAYSNGRLLSSQEWANSTFHKKDQTGLIYNGSDGRTNTSWFDYNWAGKNAAGSVINFSGFEGYSTELFSSYNIPDSIGIRSRQGDIGVWNEPRWIWHDKNFNPANYSEVLPNSGNWNNNPIITDRKTTGELAWKNYGNGHTIFDISSGVTPWGVAKSNTDAEHHWSPNYPTLVGGNGQNTYGVRVDSARVADTLTGGYTPSSFITTDYAAQTKYGSMTFGPNSAVKFLGADVNHVEVFRESGVAKIVSGHIYSHYNTNWKVGNKRGGSTDNIGYAFNFSSDGGETYDEKVIIFSDNGNIVTQNFGSSDQWDTAFSRGDFRDYGLGTTSSQYLGGNNLNMISNTSISGITDTTENRPFGYGNVINMKMRDSNEFTQIAVDVLTGNIHSRGYSNGFGSTPWKRSWTTSDFSIADYATQSWVSNNFANQILSAGNESNGGQAITLSNGNSVQITNNFVACRDGSRNPNDIKPDENGQRVRFDFAQSSYVGGTGSYMGVMTYSPWDGTPTSGSSAYQLAFANQTGTDGLGIPMLKMRKGIAGTWSDTWYKFWGEGDFSKTDIDNWNNLANTAATQSWIESQDYATNAFVEESLNKIASEHIDPDYSISARSNLNTIIITDQYPVQFLKLESDLAPGKQMTIINTAPFDIEVHKDGNIVDIVRSEETNEYYITRQQRLVKKGFYGNAKILS